MLVTTNPQPTLWEAILPAQCLGLPAHLQAADGLLDDPAFFAPFAAHFHQTLGRPSIPTETYLRLMYLKRRYDMGYETLCREVADSISWQRFARIPLGADVPHPTTLMKLTNRCGAETIEQLNDALLAKADQHKVLRLDRLRADTTVVEANVAYPTDSGLLAKAVTRIARLVEQVHAAGGAKRTKARNRRRSAGKRARAIAANLKRRTDQAKADVLRITGELADIAQAAVADAEAVIRNARRGLRRAGKDASPRLAALVDDLEVSCQRTATIITQTRTRLGGDKVDGATRLVSLHDPDARPIVKGRLGKPVEFGYKAQVTDNADGIVVDYEVMIGNPADAPLLVPAVKRVIERFDKVPPRVAADRGYGQADVEKGLQDLGVKTVAIPRKGKPSAARRQVERAPAFHKLVKWRTGCEGRISCLKRGYGWNRTLADGLEGAKIWCGWGVLAHNLDRIGTLLR